MSTAREDARRLTLAKTSARAITATTGEASQMSAPTVGNIVSNPRVPCSGKLLPRQNSARKLAAGKGSAKAGGSSGVTTAALAVDGAARCPNQGSGRVAAAGASRSTYASTRTWGGPAREGPSWLADQRPRKLRLGGRG